MLCLSVSLIAISVWGIVFAEESAGNAETNEDWSEVKGVKLHENPTTAAECLLMVNGFLPETVAIRNFPPLGQKWMPMAKNTSLPNSMTAVCPSW